jgi:hypothetical protein
VSAVLAGDPFVRSSPQSLVGVRPWRTSPGCCSSTVPPMPGLKCGGGAGVGVLMDGAGVGPLGRAEIIGILMVAYFAYGVAALVGADRAVAPSTPSGLQPPRQLRCPVPGAARQTDRPPGRSVPLVLPQWRVGRLRRSR